MKLLITGSTLFALPFLLSSAQQSPTGIHPVRITGPDKNILGNGGFETWSYGNGILSPIGPDRWFANGDTSATFTQNYIDFSRTPCETGCAYADWTAEITATQPGNYISQKVENFAEYAGLNVTFSVDFRTNFSLAAPKICIDDGVTTQYFQSPVSGGEWTRLTVRKPISDCATKLEFKVFPDQTACVNNAMAVVGALAEVPYSPRANSEPAVMEVPLGAVIDWYRFNASIPVPDGYVIADGSIVSDSSSPLFGMSTIDLRNRFVRGANDVGTIGGTGGSATIDVTHTHSIAHSHTGNTDTVHVGSGNPPTGTWLILQNPIPPWLLAANDTHYHRFTTGTANPSTTSSCSVGVVPVLPPYTGLLKIMRIK